MHYTFWGCVMMILALVVFVGLFYYTFQGIVHVHFEQDCLDQIITDFVHPLTGE